jgi:hypothetical protein
VVQVPAASPPGGPACCRARTSSSVDLKGGMHCCGSAGSAWHLDGRGVCVLRLAVQEILWTKVQHPCSVTRRKAGATAPAGATAASRADWLASMALFRERLLSTESGARRAGTGTQPGHRSRRGCGSCWGMLELIVTATIAGRTERTGDCWYVLCVTAWVSVLSRRACDDM